MSGVSHDHRASSRGHSMSATVYVTGTDIGDPAALAGAAAAELRGPIFEHFRPNGPTVIDAANRHRRFRTAAHDMATRP
jgi:hypothetical protein